MTDTPDRCRETALAGWDAGLSMLLIRQDGSKMPGGRRIRKWKRRQSRRCSRRALERIYRERRLTGVGFATGRVSGGVRLFEFDCRPTYEIFLVAAEHIGLGELVARIRAGYEEETPGGGIHWLVRADVDSGNTKLAQRPKREDEKKHTKDAVQVLIETRENGGFCITAPSNGRVHPNGGTYRLLSGGFATIATITPDEWRALCDLARSFDQMPVKEHRPPAERRAAATGTRPGDDYAARTDWAEILEPAGWTFAYQHGDTSAWWRPGKGRGQGISATTNHAGSGYLYVFSTSTDLEAGRAYGKFSAFALLHHGGDFAAAARDLVARGYGTPGAAGILRTRQRSAPLDLPPAPATAGCEGLVEENARLRARIAQLEAEAEEAERDYLEVAAELRAIKGALFEAKDYTPAERVIAVAYIEDLDQSQRYGRADEDGYSLTATGVVAQRVGMKRTNVGKHLPIIEASGAFERRKEEGRALDGATGKLRRHTMIHARLNGTKVEALRTFARSTRAEPSTHGGHRPVACPNHPTAQIVTKTHTTYHCGTCDRQLNPEGVHAPPVVTTGTALRLVTQDGSPTVSTDASPVVVTQDGSPPRKRGKDPTDGLLSCRRCERVSRGELCAECARRDGTLGAPAPGGILAREPLPAAACAGCGEPLDHGACWRCNDRACRGCGKATGAALRAWCAPCGDRAARAAS